MTKNMFDPADLKFYGATTIGERGQIVIPAEARKDFEITPSTKLLFFGSHGGIGLMITKAESVAEVLAKASEMLSGIKEVLKTDDDNSHEE
jgi:AbrB family looped-hinge helix DNA binding protein